MQSATSLPVMFRCSGAERVVNCRCSSICSAPGQARDQRRARKCDEQRPTENHSDSALQHHHEKSHLIDEKWEAEHGLGVIQRLKNSIFQAQVSNNTGTSCTLVSPQCSTVAATASCSSSANCGTNAFHRTDTATQQCAKLSARRTGDNQPGNSSGSKCRLQSQQ